MKSRLNLKAISLDIDDTVWDYEVGFRRGMTSALSKLNELDPLSAKMTNEEHFIEIREQYNQSISEDSPNRWNYKIRRYETFCKILETIARPNVKIAKEMSNAFSKGRYSENDLFSDVIPAIQELRKNFKVGIISNGDTYPENLGLENVMDFAIYAPDEKIEKPDKKIFLKAIRSVNCNPEQLLHVGDNEITDVSGAIDAGCKAVWINRFNRKPVFKNQPHFSIRDLSELLALV